MQSSYLLPVLWIAMTTLTSAAAIIGKVTNRVKLHYVMKPLSTLLIACALLQQGQLSSSYTQGLLVGLMICLIGDCVLMLDDHYLKQGLALFLVAHLVYAATLFSQIKTFAPTRIWLLSVFLASIGIFVIKGLWPSLGRLRIPVIVYAIAINLTATFAWARLFGGSVSPLSGLLAAGGAILLIASDMLVATRRFANNPGPYPLELGSYFLGQMLLTSSAWLLFQH